MMLFFVRLRVLRVFVSNSVSSVPSNPLNSARVARYSTSPRSRDRAEPVAGSLGGGNSFPCLALSVIDWGALESVGAAAEARALPSNRSRDKTCLLLRYRR
jgi:hypothetical protein